MQTLRVFYLVALLMATGLADAQSYQIGHATRTFIDNSRGGREILTEIYYPAAVAGDEVPVANPLAGEFPVIVFAHGFVIRWDAYDYLWQELVPQGYVLLFPRTEGQLLPAPDHQAFGEDMNFLATRVQVLRNKPGSPIYNKVSDKTALMGHSMGGGATYLAAANNPFITTTITWAAAETSPSAIATAADVEVPSLVLAGSEDCVTPTSSDQIPMFNALQTNTTADCKAYVELTGASHCNFTNGTATLCYTAEGFSCLFYGPFISRADQNARTMAVLTPWLETFLKGDCSAWTSFQSELTTGAVAGELTYIQSCSAPCARLSNEHTTAPEVRLYPNPAQDYLFLQTKLEGSVAIYNSMGMLVKTTELTASAIDISAFAQGVYYLHFLGSDHLAIKFTKN